MILWRELTPEEVACFEQDPRYHEVTTHLNTVCGLADRAIGAFVDAAISLRPAGERSGGFAATNVRCATPPQSLDEPASTQPVFELRRRLLNRAAFFVTNFVAACIASVGCRADFGFCSWRA